MRLDVLRVKRLKGSVLALMEVDQEGHDFAVTQFACSVSMRCPILQAQGGRFELVLLAEIIDMAEQFQ